MGNIDPYLVLCQNVQLTIWSNVLLWNKNSPVDVRYCRYCFLDTVCLYRNTSLFCQGVTLDLDYLVLNSYVFVDEQILFWNDIVCLRLRDSESESYLITYICTPQMTLCMWKMLTMRSFCNFLIFIFVLLS